MSKSNSLWSMLFLYISDIFIVLSVLELASFFRINLGFGIEGPDVAFVTPYRLNILAVLIWIFVFQQASAYKPKIRFDIPYDVRVITIGHAMASLIFLGFLYLTYRDYSRLQALYFIAIAFGVFVTHRVMFNLAWRKLMGKNSRQSTMLIIGVDENAYAIGNSVNNPDLVSPPLAGYVQIHPDEKPYPAIEDKILGTIRDLPTIVEKCRVKEVMISVKWFNRSTSDSIGRIMRILHDYPVNIRLAPDYSELAYFSVSVENFAGIPLVNVREPILSPLQRLIKRTFDIGFSLGAIIVGMPIFLTTAIAVRLDSPGPIIYSQKRVGENGKIFTMYKFRSMSGTAPENNTSLIKQRENPRITRVGRFIRRTSLDELPQFINVLKAI